MTNKATPLPLRNDTILGVCEGLGEELNVNSNLLRIAFSLIFFFQPIGAFALYLGLGALLATVRYFLPFPAAKDAVPAIEADNADEELPLAA